MEMSPISLTYQVELKKGERLTIPPALIDQIGQGRWLITIRPALPVRDHSAFLAGYAPNVIKLTKRLVGH